MDNIENLIIDKSLATNLEKKGYALVNFLSEKEIINLKIKFSEIASIRNLYRMENGVHMSSWQNEREFKFKAKNIIKKNFSPHLNSIFKNYRLVNEVFINKNPGLSSIFPIHQDWSVVDESKYPSFNIWVPLQNVDEKNGALWIIEGSHKYKKVIRGAGEIFPNYNQLEDLIKDEIKPIQMKAGQALIFYHSTIHGSGPNVSEIERFVSAATILPKEAPLNIYFKNPHSKKIEIHQPEDDFMFNYNDLPLESISVPPTNHPIGFYNEYQPLDVVDFLNFLKENRQ